MRKVSIIALVVILAGAFAVAGYGVEDTNSVNVKFSTSDISLKVVKGGTVDFGNNLDPSQEYIKMRATHLEVVSTKDGWNLSHKVTSGPSGINNVLSLGYGDVTNSQNWGKLSGTASGDHGSHMVKASYKLNNLETLSDNEANVTIQFTVSA